SRESLADFVRAVPLCDGQIGAVFSICGQVVGLDVFDCEHTFAKTAAKLIRSYAVDALESSAISDGLAPTNDSVRAFLDDVSSAASMRFKALGIGHDIRLNGLALAGAALEVSKQIVHVVAFPAAVYDDDNEDRTQHGRMVRARMRRTFH